MKISEITSNSYSFWGNKDKDYYQRFFSLTLFPTIHIMNQEYELLINIPFLFWDLNIEIKK